MRNYDSVMEFKKHATVSKCQWQHERIPPLPRDLFCSLIHQLTVTDLSWVHDTRVCAQKNLWLLQLCTYNYRGNYKQIPSTRGPKFNLQSGGMIFDNRLFCGCKTVLLLGLNMNYTAINISKEFKIFRICTKNDFWYDPFPTSPRWYRCIFPFYRTQVFHTLMILYCIPFLLKTS